MKLKFKKTTVNSGKIRWIAFYEGSSVGGFEASLDRERYKNICVTDFAFEKMEFMLETFLYFQKKEKLPIFFRLHELDGRQLCLKKIGAEVFEDTNNVTIWWNEPDNPAMSILKLEF